MKLLIKIADVECSYDGTDSGFLSHWYNFTAALTQIKGDPSRLSSAEQAIQDLYQLISGIEAKLTEPRPDATGTDSVCNPVEPQDVK